MAIVPFALFLLFETASCGAFHNIQIRQLDIVVTMAIPFDDEIRKSNVFHRSSRSFFYKKSVGV